MSQLLYQSFFEYLALEKKYSPHTITAYKKDILSFNDFINIEFQQTDISAVHYSQIRSWIVSLVNNNISNRTINRKVSSLKAFYKFLQKTGSLQVSPLSKHKALRVDKKLQLAFTSKEINAAISNIEETDFTSLRNKLIIELFYSTGIRRIETHQPQRKKC